MKSLTFVDASRSKKLAGEIAQSNVHLFSPKKSTSPRPESYKSRPKAYSQISRGQASSGAAAEANGEASIKQ